MYRPRDSDTRLYVGREAFGRVARSVQATTPHLVATTFQCYSHAVIREITRRSALITPFRLRPKAMRESIG